MQDAGDIKSGYDCSGRGSVDSKLVFLDECCRFDGEPETPKGEDVEVELELTLEDLYNGVRVDAIRDKSVLKPAKGKRKCNCRQKMVTRQVGK